MDKISPDKNISFNVYGRKISYIKISILAAILTVSGFLSGFFFSDFFVTGRFTLAATIPYLLTFVVFVIFFVLNTFFVDRPILLNSVNFLSGAFLSFGFLKSVNKLNIIVAIVAGALFVLVGIIGRIEMENNIKVRFFKTSKLIISRLFIIIALIAGFFFYDLFSSRPIDSKNPIIPQSFFEKNMSSMSKLLSPLLGGFQPASSLKEMAGEFVGKDETIKNAPQSVKTLAIDKLVSAYQEKFSSMLGVEKIDPDKKISSALYEVFISKINNVTGPTKTLILIGFSVLVFLAIIAIAPLVAWVISFFAFLVYEFLVAIGFSAVISENRSKEVIILP